MCVVNWRVGVTWKCIGLEGGIQLNDCLTMDATTRPRGNNEKKKNMDLKLPPVRVHLGCNTQGAGLKSGESWHGLRLVEGHIVELQVLIILTAPFCPITHRLKPCRLHVGGT